MDMAFLRRPDQSLAPARPAKIDYGALVAMLAAQRETRFELVRHAPVRSAAGPSGDDAMVELLLGGPGWRRALSAQRGCFSRAEAGRRINGP